MDLTTERQFGRRKYWIVAVCILMIGVSMGFCSSNSSLYLSAITDALGFKRSLFALKDGIRFLSTATVNLFFGFLIMKFGVKKLVAAGFVSLISAVLIFANANDLGWFYLGGALLGVGFAWTTTTMISYIVNRWFTKNRGTINGLILCANGLGGAVAAQIVTPIIFEEGNPFGYRNAYTLAACLLVVVGVLAVIVIREPDGKRTVEAKKARGNNTWTGITLSEAMRKPYFYLAALGIFLTGMTLQGINSVGGTHIKDMGVDPGVIAGVLSVHSLILCGSKFLSGVSYDKLGLRVTLLICQGFALLSYIALALVSNTPFGTGCAFMWGILSPLALPLETVMLPLITADLFGEKEFPKMVGIFVSLNVIGYAVGTPLINLIYDLTGSYLPMLFADIPIIIFVMLVFTYVINYANKLRREVSALEENV